MKLTTATAALSLAASAHAKLWYLQDHLGAGGSGIFSAMNFEVGAGTDNGGVADYANIQISRRRGLTTVEKVTNFTTIRVSTGPATPAGHRESVRMISKQVYNDNGLFVFDVAHMPTGCGVWPALWMVGYDWPYQGEMDIIEGVHESTQNLISTHTNDFCYQQRDGFQGKFAMSDPLLQNNCNVFATNGQGCGVRMQNQQSFGAPFNAMGGGTYAMQWDETGLRYYFWPHGSEPADIKAGKPTSEGWGLPQNYLSPENCPMWHFSQQHFVINSNLCGTFAAGTWNYDLSNAGQSGSCAARTGYSTCEAYVRDNGPAFAEAYWTIRSIKVYKAGRPPRRVPTPIPTAATATSTTAV